MVPLNRCAKFSGVNILYNVKGKDKYIDDSLKKAIEKRIPKYNQNTSHSKDTTKAKKKKKSSSKALFTKNNDDSSFFDFFIFALLQFIEKF